MVNVGNGKQIREKSQHSVLTGMSEGALSHLGGVMKGVHEFKAFRVLVTPPENQVASSEAL